MRRGVLATLVLICVACGDADPPEHRVVSSSHLLLQSPGTAPAEGCIELGTVSVAEHPIGWLDRLTGSGIETLMNDLSRQAYGLGANTVIPRGDTDAIVAAQRGRAFAGTAYRCPE